MVVGYGAVLGAVSDRDCDSCYRLSDCPSMTGRRVFVRKKDRGPPYPDIRLRTGPETQLEGSKMTAEIGNSPTFGMPDPQDTIADYVAELAERYPE